MDEGFLLGARSWHAWQRRVLRCPVARLVGTRGSGEVPEAVLELLHPAEQAYMATRCGEVGREWVAGRHCLAAALGPYTKRRPLLVRRSGAAAVPAGTAGSISHKGAVTVAVATQEFGGIGVDLEYVEANDAVLAEKVLTVRERWRLERLGGAQRAAFVTAHFSLKEAVWKAAREDRQGEMEFQDIESGLAQRALGGHGVWTEVAATVASSSWESHGCVLRDGPWILAVATRSEGR